ncbi:MAG: helicase-associated domain-containing protein [Nocardioides sp.]|uniref:helicase-associated domain-containing protein n=1 Tax=Nocardioides sp. TaxID=35761 RepID=UPI003F0B014F
MASAEQTPPARSLAEELRRWSDVRLAALLRHRPDLATPAPHDSTQLASRAATRASLARALDGLDRLELSTLDALRVAGQTTPEELATLVHAAEARVEAALRRILDLALAWPAPGGIRALSGVADVLRGPPEAGNSGLWPRTTGAPEPHLVVAALEAASPAARALLDHVEAHGGQGTTGTARRTVALADARSPVEELIARRLLQPREDGTLVLPGEVGLALRGGRTTREPVDSPAPLATTSRDRALVERAGAGAAFEFVRRLELVLDQWGAHPPAVLRNGGLAVRDLRALGRELHLDEPGAALLVEVAAEAGLLAEGVDGDGDAVWIPTDAFDAWADRPTAERWYAVATAWLRSPRTPSQVGTAAEAGKPRNALSPDLSSALAAPTRLTTLRVLDQMLPGDVLASGTGVPSLVARVRWTRPRRPAAADALVADTVSEAAALGLLGAGGLTGAARALLDGQEEAARRQIDPHLPQPVDHLLLQADLTAIAPGPLEASVARVLHLLADVESRGGATVYRFSPASVRRAYDAGWTAGEVHGFLTSVSATPVPQPLTYLVDDVSRTFGSVRVGHAGAFLRSDDEAALRALIADPRAASLGLRLVAPTVVVSTAPIDVLLPRLRELGSAPVLEAPDGSVRVARPDLLRARRSRRARPEAAARARLEASTAAVVAAVRAGDRALADRGSPTEASTPAGALALLHEAIESRQTVEITYLDQQGRSSERLVRPLRLEAGRLTAYDEHAEDDLTFTVHRIGGVRVAPGEVPRTGPGPGAGRPA